MKIVKTFCEGEKKEREERRMGSTPTRERELLWLISLLSQRDGDYLIVEWREKGGREEGKRLKLTQILERLRQYLTRSTV